MNNKNNQILYCAKSKGPINIALIKYWGKEDENLITPLNNSISLTLDMNNFYTETEIEILLNNDKNIKKDIINLTINDNLSKITPRIIEVINQFKKLKLEMQNNFYIFNIRSKNTFPIASGCASSASSMSSLVICLNKALQTNLSNTILSRIARLGSGSACRSIFGGIVEWEKEGNENSCAHQLYDENYWKLNVMLIIVNQKEKEISSSNGMKLSKETSDFLSYRINNIVPKHIKEIKESFIEKNFEKLGKIIMKDSNNFHSVCRDTFPTINYLTEESEFIIKIVDEINKNEKKIICAYTFDAGANGFIIFEENNKEKIENYFDKIIFNKNNENIKEEWIINLINKKNKEGKFINKVLFNLGKGPEIIE